LLPDMEVPRSIPQPSLEEVCGRDVPLSLREQKRQVCQMYTTAWSQYRASLEVVFRLALYRS